MIFLLTILMEEVLDFFVVKLINQIIMYLNTFKMNKT